MLSTYAVARVLVLVSSSLLWDCQKLMVRLFHLLFILVSNCHRDLSNTLIKRPLNTKSDILRYVAPPLLFYRAVLYLPLETYKNTGAFHLCPGS